MLDALFNPKTVAIIGASSKELSIGNRIVKNLLDFSFKGTIYPINPKADEICGIKAYPSILDVDEPNGIDVVHVVIPAKFVPDAVEDCGRKGVRHIIINSGGFSETGAQGLALREEVLKRARKYGIRILGPNCQGIINSDPNVRAYCNFTFTKPDPGFISIVTLSGGVAELIHQGFAEIGIGTRLYASNGNAADVSIPEIIAYMGEDKDTRVIVTYVEGLRDASRFLEVAKSVAAGKPILAMKAGRTEQGAKAAASHTGGLIKEDLVTDAIFKKAGILCFHDEGELIQAAIAFSSQPIPKGNRVGMITNTGGPAVIASDIFAEAGIEMPPLSEQAEARLKEILHPAASISNPTDVLATANAAQFRASLDVMMDEPQIDCVYLNLVTPFFVDTDSIAREIASVSLQKRKTIVCNLMTDRREWPETVRILREGGVPIYALPGVAARALTSMVQYHRLCTREKGEVRVFQDVRSDRAHELIAGARQEKRSMLSAAEVYQVLEAYGMPVAPWRVARDLEEAQTAASEIGFPVVLKIESETIVHKSDTGGIALNLKDEAAVRDAASEMSDRIGEIPIQFLVQKYLPGRKEVIVGAKAEEGVGHLLMFGLGGIYVEVLKDVVFNLTPITTTEAHEMISSIKGAALLKGVRGEKGVDVHGLVETIQRLSRLLSELPMIQELDLNPILVDEDGVTIVDGRIKVPKS